MAFDFGIKIGQSAPMCPPLRPDRGPILCPLLLFSSLLYKREAGRDFGLVGLVVLQDIELWKDGFHTKIIIKQVEEPQIEALPGLGKRRKDLFFDRMVDR